MAGLLALPTALTIGIVAAFRPTEFPRIPWGSLVLVSISFYYLWMLLAPVVLRAARRWPLEGPNRWRHAAIQLFGGLGFSLLHLVIWTMFFARSESAEYGYLSHLQRYLSPFLQFDLFIYGAIVALHYTWSYAERYHRSLQREERLVTEAVKAELDALKLQLQPHFLFNTLHTIAGDLRRRPAAAERMIGQLSDLLRYTLANSGTQRVPLEEELAVLDMYLDIERERFGPRIRVEYQVEESVGRALVPGLILQPLVENAVRHAVSARRSGGGITILARPDGPHGLVLEVRDDGPGTNGGRNGHGVGLANTRSRLARLYNGRHAFAAGPRDGGGFAVRISIPLELSVL